MSLPASRDFTGTDGISQLPASTFNKMQDLLVGLYMATLSTVGLVIDGVGNVASTVAAGCIQLTGRLITKNATPPTFTTNTGAGTGPTIAFRGGSTDLAGEIFITTGSAPAISAIVVQVKLSTGGIRPNSCFVVITPSNANAAALSGNQMVYADQAGDWEIRSGSTALAAFTAYNFMYMVIDRA